jgi:hypothetical protein
MDPAEAISEVLDTPADPFRGGFLPDGAEISEAPSSGSENAQAWLRVANSPRAIREPAQGNLCECPYDLDPSGFACGGNSDWNQPESLYPACYADPWGTTTVLVPHALNRINSAT